MKTIMKQTIRGCGYLPYVGSHNASPMFFMTVAGFIAGSARGFMSSIIAGISMFVVFGFIFLYSAYDRAIFNDYLRDTAKN